MGFVHDPRHAERQNAAEAVFYEPGRGLKLTREAPLETMTMNHEPPPP